MNFFLLSLVILCAASVHGGHDLSKEYRFQQVLDSEESYVLYWSFDLEAGTIAFAVNVSTTGWVGFGLSPNGQMPLSDVVIGWVDDEGQSKFHDRFADGRVEPSIDESQDWFLEAHSEEDGRTILEFTRALIPCDDTQDIDITASTSRIVWSYGTTDPEEITGLAQHTKQGSVSFNLLDDQNDNSQDVEGELFFDIRNDNVSIPSGADTTYWCQVIRLPEVLTDTENEVYIFRQAAFLTQHDYQYVHHMLAYICPDVISTNYSGSCNRKMIPDDVAACRTRNIFGAWAVGGQDFVYPDEVGLPVGGRNNANYVLLEMHYDNPNLTSDVRDSSGFRYYYTTKVPTHKAGLMLVGHDIQRSMIIPPSSPIGYTIFGVCDSACTNSFFPDEGITIIANVLHTHLLGIEVTMRHYTPSDDCGGFKELEPIEQNLHYDFNFQQTTPILKRVVLPGDVLVVECFYNSSRPNITVGGERTQEEMCLSFITYYPRIDMSFCLSRPLSLSTFTDKYFPESGHEVLTNFYNGRDDDFNNIEWTSRTLNDLTSAVRDGTLLTVCNGYNVRGVFLPKPYPKTTCPYEVPPRPCNRSSSRILAPSALLIIATSLFLLLASK